MKTINLDNLLELPYSVEEAVNRLRINIGFLGSEVRKIMVISSIPNEGKSFVAAQIWRQMANVGTPSVLLDMDLRKSVLKGTLGFKGESKGTSDYLAGSATLDDVLCHTQLENGDIILNTSNVMNPSFLLDSKRFQGMVDELASRYRYVFIDTPPLDFVSDGERIGSLCDGAILVVRSGMIPAKMVRDTAARLERCGCRILGVVLNRASAGTGGYYSKHYGKYYGKKYYGKYYGSKYYYYGSSSKKKKEK